MQENRILKRAGPGNEEEEEEEEEEEKGTKFLS